MAWIRARLCNACGARYTYQRRTSRYCSPACRKAAFLARER